MIYIILVAIAGEIFLGMALETIGFILGGIIILIIFLIKRRKRQ